MAVTGSAIAGLTTGSIGLAITLFKTGLDLYTVFTNASSLGRDAQVLQSQLLIQEALFKRWGNGLGLTKASADDVDMRLLQEGEGSLFQAVVMTLSSIKRILSDTDDLRSRYGLTGDDGATAGGQLLAELQGLNLLEHGAVLADYHRQTEEAERMQKRIGIMKKLTWIIKDKDKFERLVERLSGLNSGLYSLIGPIDASILAKAVAAELLQTLDLERLRNLSQAARSMANTGDLAGPAMLRQRAVEILMFPDRVPDMDIPEQAHRLKWADAGQTSRRAIGSYREAKHTSGSPVATTTTSVLIEWKTIETGLTGKEKKLVEQNTNCLAFFLKQENRLKDLHSLNCIGITKPMPHSAESIRYGLVYQLPGPPRDVLPPSLFDELIDESREFDLGDKFRVAQVLSQTLHQLHVTNWIHKAICSENVFFVRNSTATTRPAPIAASTIYLAGYEFSRPGRLRDPTQPAGDVVRGVYAHPDYRSGNVRFRRQFDIYSLGVVLLELGLWQRASTAVQRGQNPDVVRDMLLESCMEELGSSMGRVYREAVRCCLESDFDVAGASKSVAEPDWLSTTTDELIAMEVANEQENADLTASFYWKVVQPLRKLYA